MCCSDLLLVLLVHGLVCDCGRAVCCFRPWMGKKGRVGATTHGRVALLAADEGGQIDPLRHFLSD